MDKALLEELIDLMGRSPIAELEYAKGDLRIRLAKAGAAGEPVAQAPHRAVVNREPPPSPPPGAAAHETAGRPLIVKAGLFGVFFRSPAPGEPPFVEVGTVVEEGATLAILEAMKILNSVEAECRGRIVEIFQENEASVQVGAPLFAIAPLE